jgi:hypothetical protein
MTAFFLPTLVLASTLAVASAAERRKVWQPIHDYCTIIDPVGQGRQGMTAEQRINPFLSYTAIGTDFGFTGAGQSGIGWEPGKVCVLLPPQQTAGVWHSLAGRALDLDQTLDFLKCYPPFIQEPFQPRISSLKLVGRGQGEVTLECKSVSQQLLWSAVWKLNSEQDAEFTTDLPPLGQVKFLNWMASPGADFCLDRLLFGVEMPAVDFPTQVLLTSYAKLARCYSPRTGLVRDRAHIEDGAFDSIPASGMFCLATAAMAKRGVVSEEFAVATLKRTQALVSALEAPSGVLPHFVRLQDGIYKIHPRTEYSTVDTAIYLHSMLLGAEILGQPELAGQVMEMWRKLDFTKLRDSQQRIIHGLQEDRTPLPYSWYDWGGETALVLLMQAVAAGNEAPKEMAKSGVVHQGTGFIAEIQSLFYPDFARSEPDRISGIAWPEARLKLWEQQRSYFSTLLPAESFARQHALYGLSAGESKRGLGYQVSGTGLPDQSVIHPHYVLMAGSLVPKVEEHYAFLGQLETLGILPPWGMMENVDARNGEMLPMLGSLNAAFETLGAYHLLVRRSAEPNLIYDAALKNAALRQAMEIFYPAK